MFKSTSMVVSALTAMSFLSPILPAAQASVPLAVLDFQAKGGISSDEASIISDRVRTQIFRSGRFQVMERANMLSILKEQGFQQTQTGCDSTTCSVEAGKLLAVRQIMTGSVSKLGAIYTLSFRIVDVERGAILQDEYRDCRCSLEEVLTRLTSEMVTELTSPPAPQPTPRPSDQPSASPMQTSQSNSQLITDPLLAERIATLPLTERQAFYKQHEHYPLAASLLSLPVLPFGYLYLNDWGKFWTVTGIEAGIVGVWILTNALFGSVISNPVGIIGTVGVIGTWGYGVVDGFLLAGHKNQELGQLLQLSQDPFHQPARSEAGMFAFAAAPLTLPILSFQTHF